MSHSLFIIVLVIAVFLLMVMAKKQRRKYWEVKQRIKDRAFRRDE
jgi:hypothetical protein